MKISPTVLLILVSLLVSLTVKTAKTQTTKAAVPCRTGQSAPAIGFWTWPAKSHVKVFVRTRDFGDHLSYLLDSLTKWNEVLDQTESGIKFEYKGNTEVELTCEGCLTIERGTVFDKTKRHATELKVYSALHDQLITYATIIVDNSLTNPKAVADALAHEIGHNLGLLDCFTCQSKSTVMNQFKVVNVPNNMNAPTRCDLEQVSQAYRELSVRVRPSPPSLASMDQGEEPVDDDTPIVTPTP